MIRYCHHVSLYHTELTLRYYSCLFFHVALIDFITGTLLNYHYIMNPAIPCFMCILIIAVNSQQYYTGSMGKQVQLKSLLLDDLKTCVIKTPGSTLRYTYRSLYLCVKKKLFNCQLRDKPKTGRLHGEYCGSIWIHEKIRATSTKTISMQLNDGYNIHLSILYFNLPISKHESCSQNSMVLISSQFKSEEYCGFRVPWTLVIKESRIYLRMSLSSLKPYAVKLFYVGFQLNWIRNIQQIQKLHMLTKDKSTKSIEVTKSLYMSHTSNIQYTYCLITALNKYFEILIPFINLTKSNVIIHDGPGRLSNIIFDFHAQTYFQIAASSSANSIFLIIQQESFTVFRFHSKISLMKNSFPTCKRYLKNSIITIEASYAVNIACMYKFKGHYSKILIKSFQFHGPNMIDSSQFVCQYGGLMVLLTKISLFELCENVHDLNIYSALNKIILVFVSFSGYSYGDLKAEIIIMPCPTTYIELFSPGNLFESHLPKGCKQFICPPPINSMPKCAIKLGPPPLGTTEIRIEQMETLSSCNPRYDNITSNEIMMVSMKSVIVENWPFNLKRVISHTWTNITNPTSKIFDYLYSTNLTVPRLCKNSRLQIAVVAKISTCTVNRRGKFQYNAFNHIPVFTEDCMASAYKFKPVEKDNVSIGKYHDFFYKDNGDINKGHIVRAVYGACPNKCRNYKYSTFVRQKDGRTVLEFTANFGNLTFTGEDHSGFRVSMLIPNKTCESDLECTLTLSIQKPYIDDTSSAMDMPQKVIIHPEK